MLSTMMFEHMKLQKSPLPGFIKQFMTLNLEEVIYFRANIFRLQRSKPTKRKWHIVPESFIKEEDEITFVNNVKDLVKLLSNVGCNVDKPNNYRPVFKVMLHEHKCILCKLLWEEEITWVLLDESVERVQQLGKDTSQFNHLTFLNICLSHFLISSSIWTQWATYLRQSLWGFMALE